MGSMEPECIRLSLKTVVLVGIFLDVMSRNILQSLMPGGLVEEVEISVHRFEPYLDVQVGETGSIDKENSNQMYGVATPALCTRQKTGIFLSHSNRIL